MSTHRPMRALHVAVDAWAIAVALFGAFGLVRFALGAGDDGTWVWLGGEELPRVAVLASLGVFVLGALLLRGSAAVPARLAAALLALVCVAEAVTVRDLARQGRFLHGVPVPETAWIAVGLAAWSALGPARWPRRWVPRAGRLALVGAMAAATLAGHMLVVGTTDHGGRFGEYDAIVVFGARVHADGRPSGALEDRTRWACRLHREAAAAGHRDLVLVLSGGRDEAAPCSEPEAMARICREEGIPASSIVLDPTGRSTEATAVAVAAMARERGWGAVLAVSHDYHLARIQAAFRHVGLRALVSPCRETHPWPAKPLAMAREVAALASYLLR